MKFSKFATKIISAIVVSTFTFSSSIAYSIPNVAYPTNPNTSTVANLPAKWSDAILDIFRQHRDQYLGETPEEPSLAGARSELRSESSFLSERRYIIGGNWKMEIKSEKAARELIQGVAKLLGNDLPLDIIVAPSFVHIPTVRNTIRKLKMQNRIFIASQDISLKDDLSVKGAGAQTGSISYAQLKDLGVTYVLIGHSERRHPDVGAGETNEVINLKMHAALKNGLKAILAVGETADERKENITELILKGQIVQGLTGFTKEQLVNNITIAYEPVWAIGPKALRAATPGEANDAQAFIRSVISEMYGVEAASKVRIQYGGSMNPTNVNELIAQPNIDGGLIGGASLKPDQFIALIEAMRNAVRSELRAQAEVTFKEDVRVQVEGILSQDVVDAIAELGSLFNERVAQVLHKREQLVSHPEKQLAFLPSAVEVRKGKEEIKIGEIRSGSWSGTAIPSDLQKQWVQLDGAGFDKRGLRSSLELIAQNLNSGANGWLANGEDDLVQEGSNALLHIYYLTQALNISHQYLEVEREQKIDHNPKQWATPLYQPRPLPMTEKLIEVNGKPISAAMLDTLLYIMNNGKALLERGSGPYLYVPKIESVEEAELWADWLAFAEEKAGLPKGSVKVIVQIETLPAAFQAEEILYALSDYAVGVHVGTHDLISSFLKIHSQDKNIVLPDMRNLTIAQDAFLRNVHDRIGKIAMARKVLFFGGFSTIVYGDDPEGKARVNELVVHDKEVQINKGASGTRVPNREMIKLVGEVFKDGLQGKPNQLALNRNLGPVTYTKQDEDALKRPFSQIGQIEFKNVQTYTSFILKFISGYLQGQSTQKFDSDRLKAKIIDGLPTTEGRFRMIWDWVHKGVKFSDGQTMSHDLFERVLHQELSNLTADQDKRHLTSEERASLVLAADILDLAVRSEKQIPWLSLAIQAVLGDHDIDSARGKIDSFFNPYLGELKLTAKDRAVRAEITEIVRAIRVSQKEKLERVEAMFERQRKQGRYIKRFHTAEQVASIQEPILRQWATTNRVAEKFWNGRDIIPGMKTSKGFLGHFFDFTAMATFGPTNVVMADAMARAWKFVKGLKKRIEAFYFGGWDAEQQRGRTDQAKDNFGYLKERPKEVSRRFIRNARRQELAMSKMSDSELHDYIASGQYVDWYMPLLVDADEGHLAIRELIDEMFADEEEESLIAAIHIEDQAHGCKKCGHMSGKVLVGTAQWIRTLNNARFEFDLKGLDTLIVARTDAEAAEWITSTLDGRDQRFLLGATNLIDNYHQVIADARKRGVDGEKLQELHKEWKKNAGLLTIQDAVENAIKEGKGTSGYTVNDWRAFVKSIPAEEHVDFLQEVKNKAKELGIHVISKEVYQALSEHAPEILAQKGFILWDFEVAKTEENERTLWMINSGLEMAIARSQAGMPHADVSWMEQHRPNKVEVHAWRIGIEEYEIEYADREFAGVMVEQLDAGKRESARQAIRDILKNYHKHRNWEQTEAQIVKLGLSLEDAKTLLRVVTHPKTNNISPSFYWATAKNDEGTAPMLDEEKRSFLEDQSPDVQLMFSTYWGSVLIHVLTTDFLTRDGGFLDDGMLPIAEIQRLGRKIGDDFAKNPQDHANTTLAAAMQGIGDGQATVLAARGGSKDTMEIAQEDLSAPGTEHRSELRQSGVDEGSIAERIASLKQGLEKALARLETAKRAKNTAEILEEQTTIRGYEGALRELQDLRSELRQKSQPVVSQDLVNNAVMTLARHHRVSRPQINEKSMRNYVRGLPKGRILKEVLVENKDQFGSAARIAITNDQIAQAVSYYESQASRSELRQSKLRAGKKAEAELDLATKVLDKLKGTRRTTADNVVLLASNMGGKMSKTAARKLMTLAGFTNRVRKTDFYSRDPVRRSELRQFDINWTDVKWNDGAVRRAAKEEGLALEAFKSAMLAKAQALGDSESFKAVPHERSVKLSDRTITIDYFLKRVGDSHLLKLEADFKESMQTHDIFQTTITPRSELRNEGKPEDAKAKQPKTIIEVTPKTEKAADAKKPAANRMDQIPDANFYTVEEVALRAISDDKADRNEVIAAIKSFVARRSSLGLPGYIGSISVGPLKDYRYELKFDAAKSDGSALKAWAVENKITGKKEDIVSQYLREQFVAIINAERESFKFYVNFEFTKGGASFKGIAAVTLKSTPRPAEEGKETPKEAKSELRSNEVTKQQLIDAIEQYISPDTVASWVNEQTGAKISLSKIAAVLVEQALPDIRRSSEGFTPEKWNEVVPDYLFGIGLNKEQAETATQLILSALIRDVLSPETAQSEPSVADHYEDDPFAPEIGGEGGASELRSVEISDLEGTVDANRQDPKRLDGLVLADGTRIRVLRSLEDFAVAFPQDFQEIRRHWDRHYAVFEIDNPRLNYTAYVAIHRLTKIKSLSKVIDGQWRATGGTRILSYRKGKVGALLDAIELGWEMSFKNSGAGIQGLKIGGSKSAIAVDRKKILPDQPSEARDRVLISYATAIETIGNLIGGGILTGQDMNISERDAELLFQHAPTSIVPYVDETKHSRVPTHPTGVGIVASIRAAVSVAFPDNKSLEGKVFAVQGVGGVGSEVIEPLLDLGGIVIASDVNADRKADLLKKHPALAEAANANRFRVIIEDEIEPGEYTKKIFNPIALASEITTELGIDHIDVFVPAARGPAITDETLPLLKNAGVKVIAGSTNNLLENKATHAPQLKDAGILLVPDYISNAGGVTGVDGHLGHQTEDSAIAQLIFDRTFEILTKSQRANVTPGAFADQQSADFYEKLERAPIPEDQFDARELARRAALLAKERNIEQATLVLSVAIANAKPGEVAEVERLFAEGIKITPAEEIVQGGVSDAAFFGSRLPLFAPDRSELRSGESLQSIRQAIEKVFGKDATLEGKAFAVQSANEHAALIGLLLSAGAKVIASDNGEDKVRQLFTDHPSLQKFVNDNQLFTFAEANALFSGNGHKFTTVIANPVRTYPGDAARIGVDRIDAFVAGTVGITGKIDDTQIAQHQLAKARLLFVAGEDLVYQRVLERGTIQNSGIALEVVPSLRPKAEELVAETTAAARSELREITPAQNAAFKLLNPIEGQESTLSRLAETVQTALRSARAPRSELRAAVLDFLGLNKTSLNDGNAPTALIALSGLFQNGPLISVLQKNLPSQYHLIARVSNRSELRVMEIINADLVTGGFKPVPVATNDRELMQILRDSKSELRYAVGTQAADSGTVDMLYARGILKSVQDFITPNRFDQLAGLAGLSADIMNRYRSELRTSMSA